MEETEAKETRVMLAILEARLDAALGVSALATAAY